MGGISKIPGIFARQEKCFLPSRSHRLRSQPSEAEYRLSIIILKQVHFYECIVIF